MRYSPESLIAFVEAAALGSFSAAARKLKKSQSTISIAIANLEADVGCELFDRSGRQPVLNDAGRLVLTHIEAILAASERLDALGSRLSANVEPLLSVVMSDVYSLSMFGEVVAGFAKQFPDTELRCGPSEDADVIYMIQAGYAHLGILAAQATYPPDISTARLPYRAAFNIYVSSGHRLAGLADIQPRQLESERQLCLKTYERGQHQRAGQAWSAPDYLTLIEFAKRGFGWAELPVDMVGRYGAGLKALSVPGYPRYVDVDVAWANRSPLGPAGQWLIESMRAATR